MVKACAYLCRQCLWHCWRPWIRLSGYSVWNSWHCRHLRVAEAEM